MRLKLRSEVIIPALIGLVMMLIVAGMVWWLFTQLIRTSRQLYTQVQQFPSLPDGQVPWSFWLVIAVTLGLMIVSFRYALTHFYPGTRTGPFKQQLLSAVYIGVVLALPTFCRQLLAFLLHLLGLL